LKRKAAEAAHLVKLTKAELDRDEPGGQLPDGQKHKVKLPTAAHESVEQCSSARLTSLTRNHLLREMDPFELDKEEVKRKCLGNVDYEKMQTHLTNASQRFS